MVETAEEKKAPTLVPKKDPNYVAPDTETKDKEGKLYKALKTSRESLNREGFSEEENTLIDQRLTDNWIESDAVNGRTAEHALHVVDNLLTGDTDYIGNPDERELLNIDVDAMNAEIAADGSLSGGEKVRRQRAMNMIANFKQQGFDIVKTKSGRYWLQNDQDGTRQYAANGILEIRDVLDNYYSKKEPGEENAGGDDVEDTIVPDDGKKLPEGVEVSKFNFTEGEMYDLAALGVDFGSSSAAVIAKLTGAGAPVGAAIGVLGGLTSIGLGITADIKNDVSGWDTFKNAAIRTGLEAAETFTVLPLSMIRKMQKGSKYVTMLNKLVHYGMAAGALTSLQGVEWKKLQEKDMSDWEVSDWQSMASVAQFAIGFAGSTHTRNKLKGQFKTKQKALADAEALKTADIKVRDRKVGKFDKGLKKESQYKGERKLISENRKKVNEPLRKGINSEKGKTVEKIKSTSKEFGDKKEVLKPKKGIAEKNDAPSRLKGKSQLHKDKVDKIKNRGKKGSTPEEKRKALNKEQKAENKKLVAKGKENVKENTKGIKGANKKAGGQKKDLNKEVSKASESIIAGRKKNTQLNKKKRIVSKTKKDNSDFELKARKTIGDSFVDKYKKKAAGKSKTSTSPKVTKSEAELKQAKSKLEKLEKTNKKLIAKKGSKPSKKFKENLKKQQGIVKERETSYNSKKQKAKRLVTKGTSKGVAKVKKVAIKGLEEVRRLPYRVAAQDGFSSVASTKGLISSPLLKKDLKKADTKILRKRLIDSGYSRKEVNMLNEKQLRAYYKYISEQERERQKRNKLKYESKGKLKAKNGMKIPKYQIGGSYAPNFNTSVSQDLDNRQNIPTYYKEPITTTTIPDNAGTEVDATGDAAGGNQVNALVDANELLKVKEIEEKKVAKTPEEVAAITEKYNALRDKVNALNPRSERDMGMLNNLLKYLKPSDFMNRGRLYVESAPFTEVVAPTIQSPTVSNMPGFEYAMGMNSTIPRTDTADSFAANQMQIQYHNQNQARKGELVAKNAMYIDAARKEQINASNKNTVASVQAYNENARAATAREAQYANQLAQNKARMEAARVKSRGRVANAITNFFAAEEKRGQVASLDKDYNNLYSLKKRFNTEYLPRITAAVNANDPNKVKELKIEFMESTGIDPDSLDERLLNLRDKYDR